MSKQAFCTIITPDYLPYVQVLHKSLLENGGSGVTLYVLMSTTERSQVIPEGIRLLYIDELCATGIGKKISDKYLNTDMDAFRWSMKPVLIKYLIANERVDKVLYLDSDLYFCSDMKFIFDELDSAAVLLSPHWRSADPRLDQLNFQMQYNTGLFNGGFVGVNKNGLPMMDWWAMACEYVCVKDPSKGYFVDQTHLNLLPVNFENVKHLTHRGCNVASWNRIECKRTSRPDGDVWINDTYPIVFIHFTGSTVRGILKGKDPLLMRHLEKYASELRAFDSRIDLIGKARAHIEAKKTKGRAWTSVIGRRLKKLFR